MAHSILHAAQSTESAATPVLLTAARTVKHYLDDPASHAVGSVTQAKGLRSLEHQMTYSVDALERELAAEGHDYLLQLVVDGTDRWGLYANGDRIAIIDRDFGYDCFDVSATCFMERVREVVLASGIEPLEPGQRRAIEIARKVIALG